MNLLERQNLIVIVSGLSLGILGVLLVVWGNPQNSGICVSCFLENSAGALGLHDNPRMQYLRPELIGFVLGAVAAAFLGREFKSRGGSAPLPRLVAGIFLIVGCAVFIGCPIKMFLRFVAGDLTTLSGIAGLIAGVWLGLKGLAAGVHFGGSKQQPGGAGIWVPLVFVLLLAYVLWPPGFLLHSTRGSAAQSAPVLVALAVGLFLGALAQRSRFCVTGSIRDSLLMGYRTPLLLGLVAFLLSGFIASVATGQFHPGFYGQPGAHLDMLWSFLGMLLVGLISALLGGCPFRQLIKSGEGDADAGLVVIGMFIGGGLVQSWQIAATTAGVSLYGKVAVMVGLIFVLINMLLYRERVV
ncbi:YedE family putative selenium transporter [Geopsychrobacter electrodiphilus]|uniref:YedE family putative selenium transporter n=1 Tax=Geopsychrobacter electrodiphilus TaxID=225196 RepID=UPI0003616825|nr:YedE family putative selenium transporter [Geopsychrobacter electrodiphilus]